MGWSSTPGTETSEFEANRRQSEVLALHTISTGTKGTESFYQIYFKMYYFQKRKESPLRLRIKAILFRVPAFLGLKSG